MARLSSDSVPSSSGTSVSLTGNDTISGTKTFTAATPSAAVVGTKTTSDLTAAPRRWEIHADGSSAYAVGSTYLISAVSIGATSIVTHDPLPNGAQIQIDNETLTVTICKGPDNGPFTSTLSSAATAAHAYNAVVFGKVSVGTLSVAWNHAYDNGQATPVDLGWVPVLHSTMRMFADNGFIVIGPNGLVHLSGSTSTEAYVVTGRHGEELSHGTAGSTGAFFSDAQAGDSVLRSLMARLLIGVANPHGGVTDSNVVIEPNQVRARKPISFENTAQGTPPANATGTPAGWITAVVGGAYVAIPYFAVTGAPAAPVYAPLPGPGGATVANGSLTTVGASDRLPTSAVGTSPVTAGSAPAAPTGVGAVAGDTQALVTWTDSAAPVDFYTVTASPGGATAKAITSSATVTGLTNGTSYTFTVTATNSAGTSSASAPSGSVTPRSSLAYDSFDRADSSTSLGTADSGQTWVTTVGTIGISGGYAYTPTSATGQAHVAVGASDVVVSADVVSMGNFMCVTGRSNGSTTFYLAQTTQTGAVSLYKCVSGTFTQLGSTVASALSAGQTLSLSCKGTAIKALVNNAPIISVTDSSISAGTNAGMRIDVTTSGRMNNFIVVSA